MENRWWHLVTISIVIICTLFLHSHLKCIREDINRMDPVEKRLKSYLKDNEHNTKRIENNLRQVVESCGKDYKYY